jgi:hypothetical protein
VKVLLLGHSEFAGNVGPDHERIPALLAELLCERYPDEAIQVRSKLLNYLSDATLASLLEGVRQDHPDYLLLVPPVHWVTFEDLLYALKTRTPDRWCGLVDRLVRLDSTLMRMLRSDHRWLLPSYQKLRSLVRRGVTGGMPHYTLPRR